MEVFKIVNGYENVDRNTCMFFKLKASLGSKRILFSYFIITEPTELKLS